MGAGMIGDDTAPTTFGDAGTMGDASDADMGPSTEEPAATPNGEGIVGRHGRLRVEGNRVVDSAGQPIQLRGMSFFWSQWTDFYSAQNVDVMVDDWEATVVRVALGIEEAGYLTDPQPNLAKVRAVIDRAIERGIYVIIDWHDHDAHTHTAQATQFFTDMVAAYGQQPHVLFEIFNEPGEGVQWSMVKPYAEQVVAAIRNAGSDNLVIVGTPNWSQYVDVAAADRLADDNVAYTLHFYANTHKQELRDRAKSALDSGIALFVTEWGTCDASGNGTVNEGETRAWLAFLEENSISWANWALNDKDEECSAISPTGGSAGPWRDDQLTDSGRLVKSLIP